jgi:Flp pilus assembly protein TadB
MASEFGRIYLQSLIGSAEEQVELHRHSRHRLRLRLADRRLRRLRGYEAWRAAPVEAPADRPPRLALTLVSAAVLVVAALLGLVAAGPRNALAVAVVEVAGLVLVVWWFILAVACVPHESPSVPPRL